MTNPISGPSATALVGLALLEHTQQNRRDGQAARNMALELSVVSDRIANIYQGIDKSGQKAERWGAYIGAALSLYSLYGKVGEVQKGFQDDAAIRALPEAREPGDTPWPDDPDARIEEVVEAYGEPKTRDEMRRYIEYQRNHPERFQTEDERFKAHLLSTLKSLATESVGIATHQLKQWDEGNAKMKEGYDKAQDARDELADVLLDQAERDNEVINEMAKIKPVWVKPA